MGDRLEFQPLTREDKVSVLLYRTGIALAASIVAAFTIFTHAVGLQNHQTAIDAAVYTLHAAVGLSVFFIHLYIGAFKRHLIKLYLIGVASLAVLLIMGQGSLANALWGSYGPALLLPLAGCLGFVTAKEAFCFKLIEGYILAVIMPLTLLLLALRAITPQAASSGLTLIAILLSVFTLRKVTMPLAYDIGDKSAYQ